MQLVKATMVMQRVASHWTYLLRVSGFVWAALTQLLESHVKVSLRMRSKRKLLEIQSTLPIDRRVLGKVHKNHKKNTIGVWLRKISVDLFFVVCENM